MPKTIILSAGHGGTDSGAVSQDGKLQEAALAQRLRNAIAALLRADGMTVLTDGADGVNQSLRDAIALVKRTKDALAVEIHFNAAAPAVRGVEVLCKDEHKRFAQDLAKAVADVTGSPLRGVAGWKSDSSGQHHRLGFCDAGGLIIETEFISNPDAMKIYLAKESDVAQSLAKTLRTYAEKA